MKLSLVKITVITILISLVLTSTAVASDWQQFQNNMQNSGQTTDMAPTTNMILGWQQQVGSSGWAGIDVPPIVAQEKVFVYDANGKVWAFNTLTGQEIWGTDLGSAAFQLSTPGYGENKVFIAAQNGNVYALNATDGSIEWQTSVAGASGQLNTPVKYANGRIYAGEWSGDNEYHCLDASDGNILWERASTSGGGYYWAGVCVIGDYIIYGDDNSRLTCVDSTGTLVDEEDLTSIESGAKEIRSSVSYNPGTGRIYLTEKGGNCWAYDFNTATGNMSHAWHTSIGYTTSTPAVYNGKVYVGSSTALNCLSETNGTGFWTFTPNGPVQSSPALSIQNGEAYIYFTTNNANGRGYCIDENGNEVWTYDSGTYTLQGMAISDGWVYFGNDYGDLFALTTESTTQPDLTVTTINTPDNLRNDVINPITATIENIGSGDAGAFEVSLSIDSTTVDTANIASLSPGENTTVELLWTPSSTGSVQLTVSADPGDAIAESDEMNNNLSQTGDVLEKLTVTANVRIEGKNDTVWCGDVSFSSSEIVDSLGVTHYLNEPTALGALDEADTLGGFGYIIVEDPTYGLYVSEINSEPAIGWDGWMYRVNFISAWVGAPEYTLENSDEVLWYFGTWTAPPLKIELDKTNVETDETFTATVTAYNGTSMAFEPVEDAEVYVDTLLQGTTGLDGTLTISISAAGSYQICVDKGTWADYTRSNKVTVDVTGPMSNNIYLTPAHSSVANDDTVQVEIYADTADDFQGGQFYLEYDIGCANVTAITFNSMWPYTTKDFTTYTGAVFATFRKDNPMVSDTQHICTLTIECVNTEYCIGDLHFVLAGEAPSGKDSKLLDDFGTPLTDAAWNDGTFTCMNLPDLAITELYGSEVSGNDYTVTYTVTNMGNADATSGHTTTLYVDGTAVESKAVPVSLAPGVSHTDTFDTGLTMTAPNDLLEACADSNEEVMELEEYNNCMESYYPAGIEIRVDAPDECVDFQEQFTVDIIVDPRNIPVYGVQYMLSFDNSVLHAEWQNEGTFLNHDGASTNMYINNINNGAGLITFAATRYGTPDGVTNPGILATIKFTAIQQGADSNLTLSEVVVANNNGGEILPVDMIDDSVCVDQNNPPVAVGKSMHKYNNEGEKYICRTYLEGSDSYDPDGEIVYWRWGFGDGNYGAGETVDHVYLSWNWNGTGYDPFSVSLTVTDNADPHQLDDTVEFDVIVYTAGDANGDGKVNILDATIVGLEWGEETTCGAYCWDGHERADRADLNNDGKVNILDAVIIGTCWGHTAW